MGRGCGSNKIRETETQGNLQRGEENPKKQRARAMGSQCWDEHSAVYHAWSRGRRNAYAYAATTENSGKGFPGIMKSTLVGAVAALMAEVPSATELEALEALEVCGNPCQGMGRCIPNAPRLTQDAPAGTTFKACVVALIKTVWERLQEPVEGAGEDYDKRCQDYENRCKTLETLVANDSSALASGPAPAYHAAKRSVSPTVPPPLGGPQLHALGLRQLRHPRRSGGGARRLASALRAARRSVPHAGNRVLRHPSAVRPQRSGEAGQRRSYHGPGRILQRRQSLRRAHRNAPSSPYEKTDAKRTAPSSIAERDYLQRVHDRAPTGETEAGGGTVPEEDTCLGRIQTATENGWLFVDNTNQRWHPPRCTEFLCTGCFTGGMGEHPDPDSLVVTRHWQRKLHPKSKSLPRMVGACVRGPRLRAPRSPPHPLPLAAVSGEVQPPHTGRLSFPILETSLVRLIYRAPFFCAFILTHCRRAERRISGVRGMRPAPHHPLRLRIPRERPMPRQARHPGDG